MGDRATLERIFAIMRRLLLVPIDGLNPIPRKGTTRHECYRALYEIQELLETRRYFGKHLPQTKGDQIRQMSDEELAWELCRIIRMPFYKDDSEIDTYEVDCWAKWLKQEASE